MSGERKNEGTDEAYFTFDVTSGAAPLTVNSTDASTNATVYEWTIVREGADFIGISYEQNPTYISVKQVTIQSHLIQTPTLIV
jgi:PKD repeat protein